MQSTQKKPLTAFTVISTILLLLLTVLFIFPFYWIVTGAFKSQPDTIVIPPQWFPKMPTMENFQQLMVQNPALQWMWNSVFISLVTMFLVCITSSLAGYVLAKKRFYGQRILFAIFIAAMGNIDNSLVEAARVDGATELQVFWKIKWPSLLPTTLYIAIITTINSFQCFALIQLLTSGGPNYSTSTLMYYLYEKAFQLTEYGYANTIGVFLAVMIAIVSFVQFKVLGNDVEY